MAMVSYTRETMPPVSQEDWDRVAAIRDEDIDFSDMPEVTSLEGLRLRVPTPDWGEPAAKLTCEIDADISAWLRRTEPDCQRRVNAILREVLREAMTAAQ